MQNVISYRGKVTQEQSTQIMKEIKELISDCGAEKNCPIVTATFAIEQNAGQQVIDIGF